MATLKEYEARLPSIYQQRYAQAYVVRWANALLERLSGAGLLRPQRRTADAAVRDGVWVDKPPTCRTVIRITDWMERDARFEDVDGAIRLLDAVPSENGSEPPTVTILFVAAYMPVSSLQDELGLGLTYENLTDVWFRWKIEEQVASMSEECRYWGARVEAELATLRAEMFNRMNKPKGRSLAGFR